MKCYYIQLSRILGQWNGSDVTFEHRLHASCNVRHLTCVMSLGLHNNQCDKTLASSFQRRKHWLRQVDTLPRLTTSQSLAGLGSEPRSVCWHDSLRAQHSRVPRAVLSLSLALHDNLQGRSYHGPHFTDEATDTERLSFLPNTWQVVNGDLHPTHSLAWVQALDHCMPLPLTTLDSSAVHHAAASPSSSRGEGQGRGKRTTYSLHGIWDISNSQAPNILK